MIPGDDGGLNFLTFALQPRISEMAKTKWSSTTMITRKGQDFVYTEK